MKTFNILGCCVNRDIFRVVNCEDEFKVNKFVQFVNPVSIMSEQHSFHIEQSDLDGLDWTNFKKRNFCFDFNKGVQELIRDNATDYIVIDLCELRFKNYEVTTKTGEKFFATQNGFLARLQKNGITIPQLGELVIKETEISDDEIKLYLKKYADFLLSVYAPEQIILMKNLPAYSYIDDNEKQFVDFNIPYIYAVRKRLTALYDYFLNLIKTPNVIEMPDGVFGTAGHTWGIDALHFINEYYHYGYEALCLIVDGKTEMLPALKKHYSDLMFALRDKKALEYFAQCRTQSILTDETLDEVCTNEDGWKLSLAKDCRFDKQTKTLICAPTAPCWAILYQNVNMKNLCGKTLTVSVKFQNISEAMLNVSFMYKDKSDKWIYALSKQWMSAELNIFTYTVTVPKIPACKESRFALYTNKPAAAIKIEQVRIEEGTHSTMVYRK